MATESLSTKRKPVHKPLRPPGSKLGNFLWRCAMWVSTTFALSMLEPWEIILLLTIFSAMFILIITGMFSYLPQQLLFMRRRAVYYLWGQEA